MRRCAVVLLVFGVAGAACDASAPSPASSPTVTAGSIPSAVSSPATAPGARPTPTSPPAVTVTIGGDVMLGRRVGAATRAAGDPVAPLWPIAGRLTAADISLVNLESTLSRAGAPRQGGDSFAADPAVAAGLRRLGVDVVSLANNHAGDFGDTALVETIRRARAAGLLTLGAGRNAAEAAAPVVVERQGVRFGFLAFNAIGETPRATATRPGVRSVRMPPRTGPLNRADLHAVTAAIVALHSLVDVVIVLPHWGAQYTHRPHPAQRTVARALAAAGADLVVGGHPHWTQGIERYGATTVVHSLGNLVFDMDFSRQTQEGFLLELTFRGSTLASLRPVPYRIGAGFAPRVVAGAAAAAVLAPVWANSGPPFKPAN